ncbi:MAG: hypothetical protein IKW64_04830 [Clostridia bacterium]|nr:hypothetical protein [Clostridia bacterium]
MDIRQELIVVEILDRTRDFLEAIQFDASKKITEYITALELNTDEIVKTKPIEMLKKIRKLVADFKYDEDEATEIVEKIREIFSVDGFLNAEAKAQDNMVNNYVSEILGF